MAAGLILFLAGMAAISFISAYRYKDRRPRFFKGHAIAAGSMYSTLALVLTIVMCYKTAHDHQTVKTLSAMVPIYPRAEFDGRLDKIWIFKTKDNPAAVAAFYENLERETAAQVKKEDDFKFTAKTKSGGAMRIDIQDAASGATIEYILDEGKRFN